MKYCVGHRLVHLWTLDFTGSGNMAVCFLIVVGVRSSTISTVRTYVILVVPRCNICNNIPIQKIQKKPRISLLEVNLNLLKFG
jgi:hypothetical protein